MNKVFILFGVLVFVLFIIAGYIIFRSMREDIKNKENDGKPPDHIYPMW